MRKIIKIFICLLLVISALCVFDLWKDHRSLQENLIRLHIVANSDSDFDQQIKLKVKDALVAHLEPITENFTGKEQAMEYLRDNLSQLQAFVNSTLESLGVQQQAVVTLRQEAFDVRHYDTFSLPCGIYDSLRVAIGEGKGKNWWCVAFPTLCMPATTDGFADSAVSSGFSQPLTDTISNNGQYRVRFFILDCIGRLEKLFFKS